MHGQLRSALCSALCNARLEVVHAEVGEVAEVSPEGVGVLRLADVGRGAACWARGGYRLGS